MKNASRTIRTAIAAALLLLAVLPASGLVYLKQTQTYEFNANGDQIAYVCRYNFDTSEMIWHGPYTGPTDFDISFSRPVQDWIGLYTYNLNMAEYERAYYLYYEIV